MPDFGLSPEVQKMVFEILASSLNTKHKFSISVFGSRAKNKQRQYSDLDLWIAAEPAMTEQELSGLHQDFLDSDLPIKVDIVTPETCLVEYLPRVKAELQPWFGSTGD